MEKFEEVIQNRIVGYGTKPADQFMANPLNWRKHPQRQRDAVQASLRELGWIGVVVENVRTGQLVDGHERVWQALNGNEEVPYIQVDLSEDEEKLALAIYDPITYMAETDSDMLDQLLHEVNTDDPELQKLLSELAEEAGLYPDEQKNAADAPAQVDRAEELGEKWGTAPGQIWQIAQHFVICGDCREPDTWARLLTAANVDKVNGVFTSPPYAEQRKEQYGGTPADQYVEWWEAVQANAKANLANDGSFFVNIKPHCDDGERVLYVMDLVLAMKRRWGWRFVEELLWHNLSPAPGDWPERFKNGFEPIYQFATSKTKFNPGNVSIVKDTAWSGDGGMNHTAYGKQAGRGESRTGLVRPSNVIGVASSGSETLGQAAAFPAALPDFFVRAYSDKGDAWLDPFLGSGTTIVAAHQNERVGLGIEYLPKYLGVILERLQEVTGQTPRLVA